MTSVRLQQRPQARGHEVIVFRDKVASARRVAVRVELALIYNDVIFAGTPGKVEARKCLDRKSRVTGVLRRRLLEDDNRHQTGALLKAVC